MLETALQLGPEATVNNAVRFSFCGAEELGLLGSQAYVDSLDFEQQLDIAMYLNFDMIGSPNAGYFVYDGDYSDAVDANSDAFAWTIATYGVSTEDVKNIGHASTSSSSSRRWRTSASTPIART